MNKQKIFSLMGPTASGKTALALALCEHFPIDIISVDSALIYRGMDIGTAKPTNLERKKYPHYLIDIKEPNESYSVADFSHDALKVIENTLKNKRIPLLVGGTMLYFKGLFEGLSPLPKANEEIRLELLQKAKSIGWQGLHQMLEKVDKESAQRINPNDSQRINRALEVYLITGKSLTELTKTKQDSFNYELVQFAINCDDRSQLHQRIETRFMSMLEQGFEDEVNQLMQRGDLHLNMPSMRCVGYRQMWQYLQNEISYDEMVFKGVCASRQLAKRQMTWIRGWKHNLNLINHFDTQYLINSFELHLTN